jgi:hypothetical protein
MFKVVYYVIARKIRKTVGWREKTTYSPPPSSLSPPCCLGLLLCYSVHCHIGAQSAKLGLGRVVLDGGDVDVSYKPN